jgi:Ca-activated chloride channel homolog
LTDHVHQRRRAVVRRASAGASFLAVVAIPLLLVLAGAPGPVRFQPSDLVSGAQAPSGQQAFRVEVALVVLPVTVTDHKGGLISGLTQDNFTVYEDGNQQAITQFSHDDVPITVGLVLDNSGSMGKNRAAVAQAATEFLSRSNPQDELFVVNFNQHVSLGLPESVPFTSNVAQLRQAVERGPARGTTAMYDALDVALNHLALGTTMRKALILISDGGDNASHQRFPQVLDAAQHNAAIVYCIGLVSEDAEEVNPGVLKRLAKATGGQAYFPDSPSKLPAISEEIARDLREQYTLAYVPSNSHRDGGYRTIRVYVKAPGRGKLLVRTRAGYYAPSAADNASSVVERPPLRSSP